MAQSTLHSPAAVANTFKDVFRHGTTSIGIAAILSIPYLLAQVFWLVRPGIFSGLATAIAGFLVWVWLPWLLTIATRDYAQGKDPAVGEVLAATRFGRLFSYLFTQISMNLVCFGAALVGALPLAGVAIAIVAQNDVDFNNFDFETLGPLIVIAFAAAFVGLVLGFVAYVVVYLRIGLAPQASILEEKGPISSLGRSRQLTSGHRLDFVLLMVMIMGAVFVVTVVVQLPATIASIGTAADSGFSAGGLQSEGWLGPFGKANPLPQALVIALSGYVVNILGSVLSAGALANFYLALRGEELVREAEAVPPVS